MKPFVLVVEDEVHVASLICDHLTDQGFRVTYCNDAAQALIQAESMKVGLVIMDIMMPHFGSGIDAYAQLRRHKHLPKSLPVIFLTGLKPEEVRKVVPKNDPHVRLLHKPMPMSKLMAVIKELTGDSLRETKPPAAGTR